MLRIHDWIGRKDRHPVAVDAIVRRADGSTVAVKVTNCSDEGCCLESGDDFLIGERLDIAIPRMGQLKAQVRWALPGSAGARFFAEVEF
ncbi:MAG: PilZ domain-containing protein [Sphingomicrobium sp.]|jgi:hypothetical protein